MRDAILGMLAFGLAVGLLNIAWRVDALVAAVHEVAVELRARDCAERTTAAGAGGTP